jgi:hypothetical protein
MRVAEKRWGEVSIRKQGERKNRFDASKSFSVLSSNGEYDIDDLKEILEIAVNLTEVYEFKELKSKLKSMEALK